MTRFIAQFEIARDYNLQFTITHALVPSHAFTAVAWKRLTVADVPLPQGSRTVLGLNYQFLTAAPHND
jgi:hypothetical protein